MINKHMKNALTQRLIVLRNFDGYPQPNGLQKQVKFKKEIIHKINSFEILIEICLLWKKKKTTLNVSQFFICITRKWCEECSENAEAIERSREFYLLAKNIPKIK